MQQQHFFKRVAIRGSMVFLGIACLIGILLGLHYNVLVLVPVTLAVVFAACVNAMVSGGAWSAVLIGTVASTIGLQAGYVIGLMARALFGLLLTGVADPQSKRVQGL